MAGHGFCNCRQCRKARKRGLVLGKRISGYFSQGVFGWGFVSDYVRHPKFAKGRVRKERYPDAA